MGKAGAWDSAPRATASVPDEPAKPQRITSTDAFKVFLTNRQGAKIAAATLRRYRTFTKQLTGFSNKRGYVMLDQFTSADIGVFYSGWYLGARAKGKRLGTLRSYFRFCMSREWLSKNPVSARPQAADRRESCC